MKHLLAAALASCAACTVQAGQPISESMAECAAIYQASADWMSKPGRAEKLRAAADRWSEAAMAQATAEGQGDPEGYVARLQAEKLADWSGKGGTVAFTEEFRDWAAYCRSLARSRRIDLGPD